MIKRAYLRTGLFLGILALGVAGVPQVAIGRTETPVCMGRFASIAAGSARGLNAAVVPASRQAESNQGQDYASRERAARDLEGFTGGHEEVIIGGGVVLVIVLVVLLILLV
jgi:hypothetical protein